MLFWISSSYEIQTRIQILTLGRVSILSEVCAGPCWSRMDTGYSQ